MVRDGPTHDRFLHEVAQGLSLGDADAQTRIEAASELSFLPEEGAPLDVPTLVVTGRQDSSVGFEDQYALLKHYPHATFAVLDTTHRSNAPNWWAPSSMTGWRRFTTTPDGETAGGDFCPTRNKYLMTTVIPHGGGHPPRRAPSWKSHTR